MKKIPYKIAQRKSNVLDKIPISEEKYTSDFLLFSYLDFDLKQGQSFEDWQKDGLLSEKINRFHHFSKVKIGEAFCDKFKVYKGFPDHSKFKFPSHVTKDARWSSMHIKGKECVIGHIIRNIFYVVFLDKEHQFYPTDHAKNKN